MNDTMSAKKIAIFGSTGRTGRVAVKKLLENKDESCILHLLVRSKRKLQEMISGIEQNPRVVIEEGSSQDISTVKKCLSDASYIVCTVGSNDNQPGIRVIQDTVSTFISALQELKEEKGEAWLRPRMTILSSASQNDAFSAPRPKFLHWAIMNAYNYVYADLAAAEKILLSNESLLSTTLVLPPLIVEGGKTEYTTSTTSVGAVVSYEDLGAGIANVCMEREASGTMCVGVTSNDLSGCLDSIGAWQGPRNLITGFAGRLIPGFWAMHGFAFGG